MKGVAERGGERGNGTASEHLATPALVASSHLSVFVSFSCVRAALDRHNRKFSVSDGSEISLSSTAMGPKFSDVLSRTVLLAV